MVIVSLALLYAEGAFCTKGSSIGLTVLSVMRWCDCCRGFLQQRQRQIAEGGGEAGACWLFFGCRRSEEDYLYRADWEAFLKSGALSRLEVAFSRAQVRPGFVSAPLPTPLPWIMDCLTP